MTTITITVTELAHRCGISETSARDRLRRFKVGLISKDKLLHQGPMRSAGTGRPPAHPDDCELAMRIVAGRRRMGCCLLRRFTIPAR